jgi:hypothetical protein
MESVALSRSDEHGLIRGRSAEGKPIQARIAGKSLARQLMERAAAREEGKNKSKPSRRERRKKT